MLRTTVLRAGFATLVAVSSAAAAPPVIVPGESIPASVAALGPLEPATAFAVSADGAVAVSARPSERDEGRSIVRIGRADGTAAELEVAGRIPALIVTASGDVAFAIARETDKKGAIRRVALLRIDPATARGTSQVALPATANGLALAAGETSILVAAKDELRSFLLPDLTSGPLYRVSGTNGAVALLAGTSRVLVAQGARLAVVDLAAPQSRDGLPITDSVDAAAPVRMLAGSPDEPVGLALLDDGGVVRIETDPLRLVPRAQAVAIAWPGIPAPPPPPPPAVTAVPPAVPVAAPAVIAAEPHSEPASARPPAPAPEPVVEAPRDQPPPVAPPVAPPVLEEKSAAPPPAVVATPAGPGTVSGRVSGPARDAVHELTVLGPDNVLKEAARVAPDASGRYIVAELRTGTYRIVAAGENGRVLVCDPPYVTVKVSSGAAVEAPAMDVLRAY